MITRSTKTTLTPPPHRPWLSEPPLRTRPVAALVVALFEHDSPSHTVHPLPRASSFDWPSSGECTASSFGQGAALSIPVRNPAPFFCAHLDLSCVPLVGHRWGCLCSSGDMKLNDAKVRAAINQQLIESGEKERLKE